MRVQSIALLLLLSMLAWAMPAHAARSFDNCTGFITSVPTVISTPGTWCLKQDVTTAISSGDAITIASDNVVLDCNDFRLDGLAGGLATTAFGIHALNRNNLKARHCNVRGFYRGLFFEGTTGGRHLVEDNHFSQNVFQGLRVNGDGSIIRHNLVTDTGGGSTGYAYGISATGTVDVIDNTIVGLVAATGTSTPVYGISLDLNVGGSIVGNRIEGLLADVSTPHGIVVFDAETARLDVRRNQIVGNTGNGWGLICSVASGGNAPQVRVRDNVISGFSTPNSSCADAGENDITL